MNQLYDLTLWLKSVVAITPDIERQFWEATDGEATLHSVDDKVYATFTRRGESRSDAARGVILDLEHCGFETVEVGDPGEST